MIELLLLLCFGRFLWFFPRHACNTGEQRIKRVFGRHLFLTALIAAILVLAVAGAAARPQHLFPDKRDYRVVSGAFATGAVIIDIIT
jgi:hypothetical protein